MLTCLTNNFYYANFQPKLHFNYICKLCFAEISKNSSSQFRVLFHVLSMPLQYQSKGKCRKLLRTTFSRVFHAATVLFER